MSPNKSENKTRNGHGPKVKSGMVWLINNGCNRERLHLHALYTTFKVTHVNKVWFKSSDKPQDRLPRD